MSEPTPTEIDIRFIAEGLKMTTIGHDTFDYNQFFADLAEDGIEVVGAMTSPCG